MSIEDQIAILEAQKKGWNLEAQPITDNNGGDLKWRAVKPSEPCNFAAFRYRIAPQPIQRTVWINCCKENLYLFGSRQEAQLAATYNRLALKKIQLSFVPGQLDQE